MEIFFLIAFFAIFGFTPVALLILSAVFSIKKTKPVAAISFSLLATVLSLIPIMIFFGDGALLIFIPLILIYDGIIFCRAVKIMDKDDE